jgi:PadR family transcriptional regulator PadR
MSKSQPDMIRGTLDMLILKVLSLEPMHGWGISERIQQVSDDALQVNQGSLYPSLHRLTREGWIRSEWRTTENNRGGGPDPGPGMTTMTAMHRDTLRGRR